MVIVDNKQQNISPMWEELKSEKGFIEKVLNIKHSFSHNVSWLSHGKFIESHLFLTMAT